MDNPENLAALDAQDTRRRQYIFFKPAQYMLDTTIRKQTQIT
jgi:hypothetical protein